MAVARLSLAVFVPLNRSSRWFPQAKRVEIKRSDALREFLASVACLLLGPQEFPAPGAKISPRSQTDEIATSGLNAPPFGSEQLGFHMSKIISTRIVRGQDSSELVVQGGGAGAASSQIRRLVPGPTATVRGRRGQLCDPLDLQ